MMLLIFIYLLVFVRKFTMEGIKRWFDRVALVTGASTGIGAGICRELVKNGMKVVACARDEQRLLTLAEELTKGPGHIILVNIIGRRFPEGALDGLNFFCAIKSALRTITEGMRREIRKSSTPFIRVASITPGAVETEFTERSIDKKTADGLYKKVKCLAPEDVANAVLYILETAPHVEVKDIVIQPVAYTL